MIFLQIGGEQNNMQPDETKLDIKYTIVMLVAGGTGLVLGATMVVLANENTRKKVRATLKYAQNKMNKELDTWQEEVRRQEELESKENLEPIEGK